MENPFDKLSPEEIDERIETAEALLLEIDLEDISDGCNPDEVAAKNAEQQARIESLLVYRPEDWS
ncbi:MAG: hypothetical protein ACXWLH_04890 [Candidatus Saccharimonadales bacterium]